MCLWRAGVFTVMPCAGGDHHSIKGYKSVTPSCLKDLSACVSISFSVSSFTAVSLVVRADRGQLLHLLYTVWSTLL